MSHQERELPSPFAWKDADDARYEEQQRQIDFLYKQVRLLSEMVTLLAKRENDNESAMEKSCEGNKTHDEKNV